MGLVIRLAELLLILLPLIGVGYATVRALTSARGRQTDGGGTAQRILDRAVEEHDRTDKRWLDYELDAATLLDHPMVTDMREPLTQRFHRAKLKADLLRPARPADLVDDREATHDYVEAVQDYTASFDIAEAEAIRRRRDDFSVDEQERIERAQRLLRVAADAAATPQERAGAYRVARRELDGLIVLPARARAVLERGISGELN